jgi:hypothetical protein
MQDDFVPGGMDAIHGIGQLKSLKGLHTLEVRQVVAHYPAASTRGAANTLARAKLKQRTPPSAVTRRITPEPIAPTSAEVITRLSNIGRI